MFHEIKKKKQFLRIIIWWVFFLYKEKDTQTKDSMDQPPLPPHLRTVPLSSIIHRLVEKAYTELTALTERFKFFLFFLCL